MEVVIATLMIAEISDTAIGWFTVRSAAVETHS